jgi:hypothetical protein
LNIKNLRQPPPYGGIKAAVAADKKNFKKIAKNT